MRRREADALDSPKGESSHKNHVCSLLRAFAFLVLETASGQDSRKWQRNSCIRLMKVSLKAAKACIESQELEIATKVLESAAEYHEKLTKQSGNTDSGETELTDRLCVDYFAMRTVLV